VHGVVRCALLAALALADHNNGRIAWADLMQRVDGLVPAIVEQRSVG
jgi:hypothetical protein